MELYTYRHSLIPRPFRHFQYEKVDQAWEQGYVYIHISVLQVTESWAEPGNKTLMTIGSA